MPENVRVWGRASWWRRVIARVFVYHHPSHAPLVCADVVWVIPAVGHEGLLRPIGQEYAAAVVAAAAAAQVAEEAQAAEEEAAKAAAIAGADAAAKSGS